MHNGHPLRSWPHSLIGIEEKGNFCDKILHFNLFKVTILAKFFTKREINGSTTLKRKKKRP
jgi:hypothetical protein